MPAATRLVVIILLLASLASATVSTWGPQGHRLVAAIAADRLTPAAQRNVTWLLGSASLVDVATWADEYRENHSETAPWHYVNIPQSAVVYSRNRDCPRPRGGGNDVWRDCVVDRILYSRARLADTSLARTDRAMALKFLVHLVADVHQPFHAIGISRGGNDIPVLVFGSGSCGATEASSSQCTLHGVWDSTLIARRNMSDRRYLTALGPLLKQSRSNAILDSPPETWAAESLALAKTALIRPGTNIDEAYARRQTTAIDSQLVLGGLRLAVMLNATLKGAPGR